VETNDALQQMSLKTFAKEVLGIELSDYQIAVLDVAEKNGTVLKSKQFRGSNPLAWYRRLRAIEDLVAPQTGRHRTGYSSPAPSPHQGK